MDGEADRFVEQVGRRLALLVGLLAPAAGPDVFATCLAIARHRWPVLRARERPELWLYAVALRLLRRAVGAEPGAGLRALDPAVRPAVVLRHLLGLGVVEAGEALDLPADRVRSQLADAERRAGGEAALQDLLIDAARRHAATGSTAGSVAPGPIAALADAAGHYLDAEAALRRDDLSAARAGFSAAARTGFADAARRVAVVQRLEPVSAAESPSPDHNALVVAAVAGDERAMRELLALVVPLVTRYCRARAGHLRDSAWSPDDIAQDVVLSVLSVLPRYQPSSRPFVAYVLSIAANKIIDVYRASMRTPRGDLPDGFEPRDLAPMPEELALRTERAEAVGRLLADIPQRHRDILVMRLIWEMSSEEVAAVLGCSPGAVRVTQHRTLTALRTRLTAVTARPAAANCT